MTGRFVWAMDPEYKFKISNIYIFWRSPALIGSPGSVAYFGLLSYILMDSFPAFRKKKYVPALLLIFSFIRSAYLIFILYEVLKYFTKKKNLVRLVVIVKYSLPVTMVLLLIFYRYQLFSTRSIFERIKNWDKLVNLDFNFFYGGGIGEVGAAVRGVGFNATLDSYWLLMIASLGIFGFLMSMLYVYSKSKKDNKTLILLFSFFIAGVFITYTQSIAFLALFPLFFIREINQQTTSE